MEVLGVSKRRVAGYEYNYRFSIDDEIVKLYKFEYHRGEKTYLFEIRTSFIMKTIEGEDSIMNSERFDAKMYGDCEQSLMVDVVYRLGEYWMTQDEIIEFVEKAFNFAVQTGKEPNNGSRWLIPIVVHLEVCTVQQEGESVDSVNNRAIREEKLVPFVIFPRAANPKNYPNNLLCNLFRLMTGSIKIGEAHPAKTRVEDVEDGMAIMPLCDICLSGPMLGTYISVLPACNHAFHSHCIVKWMLGRNYMCPTCDVCAYPYVQVGLNHPLPLPRRPVRPVPR